jgi:hypothetical protein
VLIRVEDKGMSEIMMRRTASALASVAVLGAGAALLAGCGSSASAATQIPSVSAIRAAMLAQPRIASVIRHTRLTGPRDTVRVVQVRRGGYQVIYTNGKLVAVDRNGFDYGRTNGVGCWQRMAGIFAPPSAWWGRDLDGATAPGYQTMVTPSGQIVFRAPSGQQITVNPRTDLIISWSAPGFAKGGVPRQSHTYSYPSRVKELPVPRVCAKS